ncbi:uncharacterized protein LOC129722964 [Wyeomyia smithii]|uniref:uncharacterized protein LOC129722964 n=1 Tax=Wyeomyia smithii TaxID=174621 RepID=UPI002467B8CE|nr:uncharacterized protein LOC129722964 [Wyeomyia smithii]
MKLIGLLLCSLMSVALGASLLDVLARVRRDNASQSNQGPVSFGFPVFNSGGPFPTFGGGGVGGWPQVGGGFGGGNLQGRFNFDDLPNVEGGQVTSGVSCTYSKDGKQKCTHHQHHERNKN